jgi:hypothetical protein
MSKGGGDGGGGNPRPTQSVQTRRLRQFASRLQPSEDRKGDDRRNSLEVQESPLQFPRYSRGAQMRPEAQLPLGDPTCNADRFCEGVLRQTRADLRPTQRFATLRLLSSRPGLNSRKTFDFQIRTAPKESHLIVLVVMRLSLSLFFAHDSSNPTKKGDSPLASR